ncbi:HNH endonuclease signature motif containing protein [Nodosilinea sp. P-1105]|uniref:HNH endonuclease n=1 Tax=Nodosilinea sp. P-1105 TaxID=2546229 RepID=UPI00146B7F20|nr:HNH endonuclease signature motif containing protein [Nodosilinea sp. P-1105]NMF86436.1 HNH endonuclease [Nodosilinea sp. P-1105]
MKNNDNLAIKPSQNLHVGTALKIFEITIAAIQDPQESGTSVYYGLKHALNVVCDPDVFSKTTRKGILYALSHFAYNEHVLREDSLYSAEDGSPSRFHPSTPEHFLWYAEDFLEFSDLHQLVVSKSCRAYINEVSEKSSEKYESEDDYWEHEYYDYLRYENRRLRIAIDQIRKENKIQLEEISDLYLRSNSERVFNDRELCSWISSLIIEIGFPGETRKWIDRPKSWPTWLKRTLDLREKGKCANCGVDYFSDISITTHIDHIVPLSKGGCNDLVNLQILCETCNTKKGAYLWKVKSSIPKYISERLK